MRFIILTVITGFLMLSCKNKTIYENDAFYITPDRVVQGEYEARALSENVIESNYRSDYKVPTKREVYFKFSINGGDNERFPGEDHRIILDSGNKDMLSAVYPFGEPDPEKVVHQKAENDPYLKKAVAVTLRCDFRHVLAVFEAQGAYTTQTGVTIDKEAFEGLYIAGGTAPLSWDFASLAGNDALRMRDENNDGIYEITLNFQPYQQQEKPDKEKQVWRLTQNISGLPAYQSPLLLIDALYNLSLEEMLLDIREDGAFMAGKKWPGVWTRDISYSILLSLAALQPEASKKSLMAKVNRDRIIQDTGTGGSWPVSTDRMTWSLAAWEVYKVSGERDWLEQAFKIIKNSAEDDLQTARDPHSGLFYGESSFLDWREQSYPRWMDPKDIYRSQCLGTNAVHFQTYRILSEMAEILGKPADKYRRIAAEIRDGINRFMWQEERGYYGQFRYGRNYPALSRRSETLGAALSILFGIADSAKSDRMTASLPVTRFGPTCIYPQIPDIPPYHNNGIWPFVVAYRTWAAAEAGNAAAVEHGMASIYRAAALFLTNKENFVAGSGDFMGTEINSDRQLWSVAGNLALVYRVMLGMRFGTDYLTFEPFVPCNYDGTMHLTGFKYRDMTLDITVEGFGSGIAQILLDGEAQKEARVDGNLQGHHELYIRLNDKEQTAQKINMLANHFSPVAPKVSYENGHLKWPAIDQADTYVIFENGREISRTRETAYPVQSTETLKEIQVLACDADGWCSFLNEPLALIDDMQIIEAEQGKKGRSLYDGFQGSGYIEISKNENRKVSFNFDTRINGVYALDFKYANGEGPINTSNKCALRNAYVDGQQAGTFVFPQRGNRNRTDWGWSNPLRVALNAGSHRLELRFEASNENMNGDVNRALLDALRIRRLE